MPDADRLAAQRAYQRARLARLRKQAKADKRCVHLCGRKASPGKDRRTKRAYKTCKKCREKYREIVRTKRASANVAKP